MMQRTSPDPLPAAYAALQAGRFEQALSLAEPAARRRHPAAVLLHALAAAALDHPDAPAALQSIADANPAARHPVLDLADLLLRLRRPAAAPLRAAIRCRPDDPALHTALGAALSEHGDPDPMRAAFAEAVRLRPDSAAAWSNLGKAEAATFHPQATDHAFARAAALAPSDPQLQLNHAVALLRAGRMAEGWPPFRARHRLPGRPPPPPGPELTSLDGAAGRTVLLLHDEGFGDTLQFLRFLPLLRAAGLRPLVQAPPPLHRLLDGNAVPRHRPGTPFHAWCRIPDLPALFGTAPGTIPPPLPGFRADPVLVARWNARLPPSPRRVGLVWAGAARSHHPAAAATDRVRSLPPELLRPLLALPGITPVSLQHGQPPLPGLHDPMPDVADFADTAAIIAGLHAVVSVDTAVAHLAATLGCPVLLLNRFDGCWRWMDRRADSPWYPGTLRVLRQPRPGDWSVPVAEAAALLLSGVPRPC